MNKLNEVKLAIYEKCNKGEITNDECKLLLEKAEERYFMESFSVEDLSEDDLISIECVLDGLMSIDEVVDIMTMEEAEDEEDGEVTTEADLEQMVKDGKKEVTKTINKEKKTIQKSVKKNLKFKQMASKAFSDYSDLLSSAKKNIKEKNFNKAKSDIDKCTKILSVLKKEIQSFDTTPTDDVVSFTMSLAKKISNEVIFDALSTSIMNLFDIATKGDTTHKMDIGHDLKMGAAKTARSSITSKMSGDSWNAVKGDIITSINIKMRKLRRLSNKISKLEKKAENQK